MAVVSGRFFSRVKQVVNYMYSRSVLGFTLAAAWTLLIFVGCSLPGKEIPQVSLFDHVDKVIHFTFFFIFTLSWYFYYRFNLKIIFWIMVVGVLYGFALEYYQLYFVEGRSFDVWDGLADSLGSMCGGVVAWWKGELWRSLLTGSSDRSS